MNYNIDWEKTVENIKYLMLGRTYKKNFSRVFGVDVRAVQKKISTSAKTELSIRELMRVMSIPDDFKWSDENINNLSDVERKKYLKKYELKIRRSIGEAVPTKIMYQIAKKSKQMLDFESFVSEENMRVDLNNYYIQSYIYEHNIDNAKETGAFYTPQSVVFESLKYVDLTGKNNFSILEPSVGMGAYIPQIIALLGDSTDVTIDLCDINGSTLTRLKEIISLLDYNEKQIKFNFIEDDFLLTNKIKPRYDLIVANPPYVKLKGKEILKYRQISEDKTLYNTFGLFMERMANMSNEIVLIIPKYFLMTPEFNNLRNKYKEKGIVSIVDFGVCFFKEVFIEIISIHFKSDYNNKLIVEDLRENKYIEHEQNYIQHDKMWIIYRNHWFDEYIKTLKLDVFDYFRDRQLRKNDLQSAGKIRVLKSKNLNDVGDIVNIDKYDSFIDDIDVYNVKKYLNSNKNYFEGWYFKHTNKKNGISFIPGISITNKEKKAFIQIITTDSSYFVNFDIKDFEYSSTPFYIKIKNNFFSKNKIHIDIKDDNQNLTVYGDIKYTENKNIKTNFINPNIMGPFSYIPFMECNHAILSMKSKINGYININNKIINFNNNIGYIEKDWGCSFPKNYIWCQGNNFKNQNASFMISIANIPFKIFTFQGIICSLILNDKEYRFATYNNTKILKYEIINNSLNIILKKRNYYLNIKSTPNEGHKLIAPVNGNMEKYIFENISSIVTVTLKKNNKVIFSETSRNCGLEIVKE